MKKNDRYYPIINILKSINILIIGAVLGAIISHIFNEKNFSTSPILLCIIFLCLASLIYISYEVLSVLNGLKNRVGIKITYIDKKSQNLFEKTKKAIESAYESILILNSPQDQIFSGIGIGNMTSDHVAENDRNEQEYFQALVASALHKGVSYIRIMQLPDGKKYSEVYNNEDKNLSKHINDILALKQNDKNISIGLLKAPMKSLTTFVLIDEKKLIWSIDEIDNKGLHRMRGIFLIEDPRREITQHFRLLFDNVFNNNLGTLTFSDIDNE